MRTFYTILLSGICFFYSCQETIDFSAFEQDLVILKNPIRFDQLAVGQKNTYISIQQKKCGGSLCCEPNLDTLRVEIMAKDTNGYLIKETTNVDTTSLVYYLDYYTGVAPNNDTLGVEPNIEESRIRAIITKPINGDYSNIFRLLGAKFYLNNHPNQSVEAELNGLCEVFFLPNRENDPLPDTDHPLIQHSEFRFTRNYSYETYNFGSLLLGTNDYGYHVDARAYNFGYSLEYGLVFSGFYRVSTYSQVWHLVPNCL